MVWMKFYAESCVENDEDAATKQKEPQEPRLLPSAKCVARLVKIILRASFHLFMLQDGDARWRPALRRVASTIWPVVILGLVCHIHTYINASAYNEEMRTQIGHKIELKTIWNFCCQSATAKIKYRKKGKKKKQKHETSWHKKNNYKTSGAETQTLS